MNFLRPQFTIFPQPYVLARNHLCSFLWGKNKKKTKKGFVWSYHHIVLLLNTIYKVNFFLAFLYKGQLTTTRADIHYSQIICQTNGLFRKRAFQIFKQRIFFFGLAECLLSAVSHVEETIFFLESIVQRVHASSCRESRVELMFY